MPIEAPLAAQASMPGHPATDHQSAPLLQAKAGSCTDAAIGPASHAEPLPSSTVTPLRNDRSTSVG